jgi:hypothetical protein
MSVYDLLVRQLHSNLKSRDDEQLHVTAGVVDDDLRGKT